MGCTFVDYRMRNLTKSTLSATGALRFALILLVALPGVYLHAQNTAPDPALLNQEFLKIINEYRASKQLKPLALEAGFYPYVLAHSQTMAKDDEAHHNRFEARMKSYWKRSGKQISIGENAAYFYLPTEGDETGIALNDELKNSEPAAVKTFVAVSESVAANQCHEACYALYAFNHWRTSKPHHALMVDPRAKSCYVAYVRRGEYVYFALWVGF